MMKAGKACCGIKELKPGSSFGIQGADAQERSLSDTGRKGAEHNHSKNGTTIKKNRIPQKLVRTY